jgi:hypothetical protein
VEIDEDTARGYELVFAEAERALSQQREAFESLRTRAGVLLSGAAITSSVLGERVSTRPLSVFGWLAAAAFVGLGSALLSILWPRPQWRGTPSPIRLIESRIEVDDPTPLPLTHRDMAYGMHAAYSQNQVLYEQLTRHFQLAALLLGIEVLALTAGLTGA